MTTMTAAPTIGRRGVPVVRRRSSGSLINTEILDATISRVLAFWAGESLAVSPGAVEVVVPVTTSMVRSYPKSPVEAVEYIRDVLDMPISDVVAAVRVPERTYYGWKNTPGRRPRTPAKLWLMVEVLFDLASRHPNLASWFHTNAEVRRAFAAGDTSRLQLLELEAVTHTRPDFTAPTALFGDPGDPKTNGSDETHAVSRPAFKTSPTRPRVRPRRPPNK